MPRIIAFFNQKGGTAKTTSTLNVAAALAERGHRVLAMDLDPQASLTMAFGIDVAALETSVYDLFLDDDIPVNELVVPSTIDNVTVIRATPTSRPPRWHSSTSWNASECSLHAWHPPISPTSMSS